MEQKTKVRADDAKQEIWVTREFDLPLELLFKAYIEPEFVEQWMGTKVLKLESKKHGSFQFQTTDPQGNKHDFSGVIHEFSPNQKASERLKWKACLLAFSLKFWNFKK